MDDRIDVLPPYIVPFLELCDVLTNICVTPVFMDDRRSNFMYKGSDLSIILP